MSGASDDLNLQTILTQLERDRAETRKFVAEQNKLAAEAAKLRVDRLLAPAVALSVASGAIGGMIALLLRGGLH